MSGSWEVLISGCPPVGPGDRQSRLRGAPGSTISSFGTVGRYSRPLFEFARIPVGSDPLDCHGFTLLRDQVPQRLARRRLQKPPLNAFFEVPDQVVDIVRYRLFLAEITFASAGGLDATRVQGRRSFWSEAQQPAFI